MCQPEPMRDPAAPTDRRRDDQWITPGHPVSTGPPRSTWTNVERHGPVPADLRRQPCAMVRQRRRRHHGSHGLKMHGLIHTCKGADRGAGGAPRPFFPKGHGKPASIARSSNQMRPGAMSDRWRTNTNHIPPELAASVSCDIQSPSRRESIAEGRNKPVKAKATS